MHAWVRVGSIDESDADAGIAHVIEHMVFKGTAHYGALDIARWVESMGGAINAETSKEYTHYYIDVPSDGTRKAVHILSDMIFRANFEAGEWRRECPVILEEIKRRNDDPDVILWDLLNEAVFDDPSQRRPVIGSPATVGGMQLSRLKAFYRSFYSAHHTILVLTGDFSSREAMSWIKNDFGAMPRGALPPAREPHGAALCPRQLSVQKRVRQSYLGFGISTPPADHPDQEALDLIAVILGEGRSARLVRALREEQKLVWSISASNMTHAGPGLFAIFAECVKQKEAHVIEALNVELQRLKRVPPSTDELARAKQLIQTSWLQGIETIHSKASTIGSYALDNHLKRLRDYLPKMLRLNPVHIRNAIKQHFERTWARAVVSA